jgi:thiamine phosphate synthase YjbQ (UPF0047 family)
MMPVRTGNIAIKTRGNTDILDITRELEHLVAESGLRSGTLTVFCPSSTSGVTTVEYEPGAVSDLKGMFE